MHIVVGLRLATSERYGGFRVRVTHLTARLLGAPGGRMV